MYQERRMILIYPGIDNIQKSKLSQRANGINTIAAKPKWYKKTLGRLAPSEHWICRAKP